MENSVDEQAAGKDKAKRKCFSSFMVMLAALIDVYRQAQTVGRCTPGGAPWKKDFAG